jgi:hypothetical protein
MKRALLDVLGRYKTLLLGCQGEPSLFVLPGAIVRPEYFETSVLPHRNTAMIRTFYNRKKHEERRSIRQNIEEGGRTIKRIFWQLVHRSIQHASLKAIDVVLRNLERLAQSHDELLAWQAPLFKLNLNDEVEGHVSVRLVAKVRG